MKKSQLRRFLVILTMLYCIGVFGYAFYYTLYQSPQKRLTPAETQSPFKSQNIVRSEIIPPLLKDVKAPDFTLTSLQNQPVQLARFQHKKWVLIEFFASWCPHCQRTVPYLQQLQQKIPDKLQILAINAGDNPKKPSTAKTFQNEFKISYTILDHPSSPLLEAYHLKAFPTMYLIDPSGRIAWGHLGELSPETTQKLLAKINSSH